MRTNYTAPQVEVVEIEVEGMLCQSGNQSNASVQNFTDGGNAW